MTYEPLRQVLRPGPSQNRAVTDARTGGAVP